MIGSQGSHAEAKKVTVEAFFEAGKERLGLELVAGKEGIGRQIMEAAVNRPGLALTGFFQYFAHRRIQVFGHAEHAYLSSLDEPLRASRLRTMFEKHIPCVIVTRHRKVMQEIEHLGGEMNVPVMRSPMITGDLVNLATMIMEDLQAPESTQHGTMVEILGIGVLITGKPGIGKSEAALSLIKKGHILISDDVTLVRLDSTGVLMASSPKITRYHLELRGLGIIHVPSLFGIASVRGRKKLDLIVNLMRKDDAPEDFDVYRGEGTVEMMGVPIPQVTILVAPGRDLAGMIEVAALDRRLKELGHDAAKELDEKLILEMAHKQSAGE